MKKTIFIILIILQLFILSCESNKEPSYKKPIYDIEILYRTESIRIIPNERLNEKYLYNGKLYLHFCSMFKNDTMDVKKNDKFFKRLILNTEASTGTSYMIEFEKMKRIENISLSLNGGKEVTLDIDKRNHIEIFYKDSTLTVIYLDNVPYYD